MKKSYVVLVALLYLILCNSYASASSMIMNDESDMVYIGSYQLEMKRYDIGKIPPRLSRQLYGINMQNGEVKQTIKSDSPIYSYEISNKGYIAISTREEDEHSIKAKTALLLFDRNGAIIKEIEDVPCILEKKYYSWSEDGMKISYVTGETLIEDRYPFSPKNVWIYDLSSKETKKIADNHVQVNWSRHDNNIYIQGDFDDTKYVSVYDTSMNQLLKSKKKGIEFSDDGLFYLSSEMRRVEISRRGIKFHKTITVNAIFQNNSKSPYYQFSYFGNDSDGEQWSGYAKFIRNSHKLLMWDYRGKFKIFDTDNKKTLRESKNILIGWNEDMTKVVVYEGGEKIHIDELLTGKRLKSIDIPK